MILVLDVQSFILDQIFVYLNEPIGKKCLPTNAAEYYSNQARSTVGLRSILFKTDKCSVESFLVNQRLQNI